MQVGTVLNASNGSGSVLATQSYNYTIALSLLHTLVLFSRMHTHDFFLAFHYERRQNTA